MRNLKKILAMVLALVMSLSLMATASATDFTDDSSINDTYKIATEVLSGLGVFNGYQDGSFQPQGSITRAETAAIIYRIVTGDVDDKQVGIYADYNIFPDVPGTAWHAGYVNFCANAEYIKGRTDGKFDPQGKVTGYEALAMILRAIGYTANGGFTGPDWAVQTARTAESRKITKNINTGTLGEYASRETVAEILFQAILVNMVDHNVLHTLNGQQGYTEGTESLGYKTFKLEEFVAVVTGNEFADLSSPQVLPEGKTEVLATGEDNVRTLNTMTKITDIGESRLFYTQNGSKVLSMTDSGMNTTKEYGLGVDISTLAKFRDVAGMVEDNDTEFYTDFEPTGYYDSDWRIEYTIWLDMTATEATRYTATIANGGNGGRYLQSNVDSHSHTGTATPYGWYNYNKVINVGDPITLTDMANIYNIFATSNGVWNSAVDKRLPDNELGQVFVATQTKDDISDTLSYKQFVDKYINPLSVLKNWNTSNNGEWVKFIDNDGDGYAEYAFLTHYTLTEAVSSYTNKDGKVVMQYALDDSKYTNTDFRAQNFDDDDHTYLTSNYTVRYMKDDEPVERDVAVGDIVLAAWIDNQFLVSDAESVTTQANSYNYKDDAIVAADGNTYTQSRIWNATSMQLLLASMAPKTTYEMFLDKFGFVRAYRLPGGTQYALVTEMYFKNNQQGNLIQNWPMTVELVTPNEDGTGTVKKEYNLVNTDTEMRAGAPWTQISNLAQSGNYYNWLQPAIAHLGVSWTGMTPVRVVPTLGDANMTYWANSLQLIREIKSLNGSTEFNYGPETYIGRAQNTNGNPVPAPIATSFTNVAVVSIDGDNATINGAAKVRVNQAGQASGKRVAGDYAVDYIQLTTDWVAAGAVGFPVADKPVGNAAAYNRVVNANNDTEIYVIYDGDVLYFKGYKNIPALNKDTVTDIHAAYAVARNTNTGTGITGSTATGTNYWIADVLVFEVETWNDTKATSISLAYWTASQQLQSATSVTIDTLNSKNLKVQLQPAGVAWGTTANWWSQWGYNTNTGYGWQVSTFNNTIDIPNRSSTTGYGFYRLYNDATVSEGLMSARAIEKITKDYNKAGIFAGVVTREVNLATSGFIPVNTTGKRTASGDLRTDAYIDIASEKVFSITDGSWHNATTQSNYWEANNLWYNNTVYSNVKANDRVVWVGGTVATNNTVSGSSFLVDMGSNIPNALDNLVDNTNLWAQSPAWLTNLWAVIYKEQVPVEHPIPGKEYGVSVVWTTENGATTDTDDLWNADWDLAYPTVQAGVPTYVVKKALNFSYGTMNKPWNIKVSDLNIPGYKIQAVSAVDAADGTTAFSLDGTSNLTSLGVVGTANLAKNIILYVNVEKITYQLQVKGGAATATLDATYSVWNTQGVNVVPATAFKLDGTGSTTPNTLGENATFTVTIPVPNPLKSYTATIADPTTGTLEGANALGVAAGTVNPDKSVTFTGKVTGGTTVVTISEIGATEAAEATIIGDNLTTETKNITWTLGATNNTTAVDVTSALDANCELATTVPVTAVSVTDESGNPLTVTSIGAGDVVNVQAPADYTGNITVNLNKAVTLKTINVAADIASGITILWTTDAAKAQAGQGSALLPNGSPLAAGSTVQIPVPHGETLYLILSNGTGACKLDPTGVTLGTGAEMDGDAILANQYMLYSFGPITAGGTAVKVVAG